MSETYRILVTGSRSWTDWVTVWTALEDAVEEAYRLGFRAYEVRHGCAEGADRIAAQWCEEHAAWYEQAGQTLWADPRPADWAGPCRPDCPPGHRRRRRDGTTYCPAAGLYRDAHMVELGAHVCLAFIAPCRDPRCRRSKPHGSHGASHTARLAEKAGIPTRRFP